MRWSNYILLMTCFTLMLYLGGYSSLAGGDQFNTWLTNMAGRNSTSINMTEGNDSFRDISSIKVTDLATGKTNSDVATNQTGLLGMFGIDPSNVAKSNPLSLLLGFGLVALGLAALGFGANFIIPLLILLALLFMNLFFFPLDFLLDMGMPAIIKVFIPVILNLMLILAVMDFMRGGA